MKLGVAVLQRRLNEPRARDTLSPLGYEAPISIALFADITAKN